MELKFHFQKFLHSLSHKMAWSAKAQIWWRRRWRSRTRPRREELTLTPPTFPPTLKRSTLLTSLKGMVALEVGTMGFKCHRTSFTLRTAGSSCKQEVRSSRRLSCSKLSQTRRILPTFRGHQTRKGRWTATKKFLKWRSTHTSQNIIIKNPVTPQTNPLRVLRLCKNISRMPSFKVWWPCSQVPAAKAQTASTRLQFTTWWHQQRKTPKYL